MSSLPRPSMLAAKNEIPQAEITAILRTLTESAGTLTTGNNALEYAKKGAAGNVVDWEAVGSRPEIPLAHIINSLKRTGQLSTADAGAVIGAYMFPFIIALVGSNGGQIGSSATAQKVIGQRIGSVLGMEGDLGWWMATALKIGYNQKDGMRGGVVVQLSDSPLKGMVAYMRFSKNIRLTGFETKITRFLKTVLLINIGRSDWAMEVLKNYNDFAKYEVSQQDAQLVQIAQLLMMAHSSGSGGLEETKKAGRRAMLVKLRELCTATDDHQKRVAALMQAYNSEVRPVS